MSTVSYPLEIVPYSRGVNPVTRELVPYHWAFHIIDVQPSISRTMFHELLGTTGEYRYEGGQRKRPIYSTGLAGGDVLRIGSVPEGGLDAFENMLESVHIDNDAGTSFSCQRWTINALTLLREAGHIDPNITNEYIFEHFSLSLNRVSLADLLSN